MLLKFFIYLLLTFPVKDQKYKFTSVPFNPFVPDAPFLYHL